MRKVNKHSSPNALQPNCVRQHLLNRTQRQMGMCFVANEIDFHISEFHALSVCREITGAERGLSFPYMYTYTELKREMFF